MAAKLSDTYACQPSTQRGRGILIDGHVGSSSIAYCNGKCVILRSLEDPRKCTVYSDHAYPTTVARFSPNGEWVASGDSNGTVRVWARGGENVLRFENKALVGAIEDLGWSHDGERIVVCGESKQHFVRAFMWDSGGNLGDFEGHSKRVMSCAFRPKRPFRVFSCGEDFAVNYYEGPPFRFKLSNKEHSNFVNCVRFSPDGSLVLSVSSDKKGFLFNGQTGEKVGELSSQGGHAGSIYAASWSPDSKHVVTVSADKTAKVWAVAEGGSTGEVVATFLFSASGVEQQSGGQASNTKAPVDFMQVGCLWLRDSIVTVSLNGTINVISATSISSPPPPRVRFIQGHAKYVTSIASAPASGSADASLYTASYDGSVVRWNEVEGVGTAVEGLPHSSIAAIACEAGQLITVGLDDTMRLTPLPAHSFASASSPIPLAGEPKSLSAAAPAGTPLLLVATVKGLQLFQGDTLLATHPLPFEPSAAALHPGGKQAAVGSSRDGTILLLEIGEGGAVTETGSLERHRGPITALCYSPDGAFLASGDQNREAVVWDCATKEAKLKNLVYHTARVSCLAWSPDSSAVATGSLDMSIMVYPLDQPPSKRVTIKGAHSGGLSALLFQSPKRLVSAGLDACLRVWELE